MRVMPTCRDIASAVARGEIASWSLRRRMAMRWHLFRCRDCRRYVDQIRSIGRAAGELYRRESAAGESLQKLEASILSKAGKAGEAQDLDRSTP